MKIEFADSFWESLDRLQREQRWYYKLWVVFKRGIPNFFKNVWYFRRELYDFEAWDYRFNLNLLEKSLRSTADYIEHQGIEENESRLDKVAKMRRAIELLEHNRNDDYIERAEAELGELHNIHLFEEGTPEQEGHNRKVFIRSQEIEEQDWNELWEIIKGNKTGEPGIRSWWD